MHIRYTGATGSDEFGILKQGCPLDRAVTIRNAIAQLEFTWQQQSFSIGIIRIDNNFTSVKVVLQRADTAFYTAKNPVATKSTCCSQKRNRASRSSIRQKAELWCHDPGLPI